MDNATRKSLIAMLVVHSLQILWRSDFERGSWRSRNKLGWAGETGNGQCTWWENDCVEIDLTAQEEGIMSTLIRRV